jgi:hypothetical protein
MIAIATTKCYVFGSEQYHLFNMHTISWKRYGDDDSIMLQRISSSTAYFLFYRLLIRDQKLHLLLFQEVPTIFFLLKSAVDLSIS